MENINRIEPMLDVKYLQTLDPSTGITSGELFVIDAGSKYRIEAGAPRSGKHVTLGTPLAAVQQALGYAEQMLASLRQHSSRRYVQREEETVAYLRQLANRVARCTYHEHHATVIISQTTTDPDDASDLGTHLNPPESSIAEKGAQDGPRL